jgi:hypothetical protein
VFNIEPPVILSLFSLSCFHFYSHILDFYTNINMISELKVLNSNLNSVIYLPFHLNIPRVRHHLLKESLSPHVRGSVKVLIK